MLTGNEMKDPEPGFCRYCGASSAVITDLLYELRGVSDLIATLLDTRNLPFQSAPRYLEGLHDESTSIVPSRMAPKKGLVWQSDGIKTQFFSGWIPEFWQR
jgi:hypothetical protein